MKSSVWLVIGVALMLLGLPRGGSIGVKSFVFLGLGVALVIVALREAPWPEPHRGPPPDEVDRRDGGDDAADGVDSRRTPGGKP